MPATPRVTPRTKRPTHDITLSDGVRTYGLRVDPTDLKEVPQTPSTLHLTAGGGSAAKYGDFDPTMAQLVQNDWSGGRGQENFSDDPSRFFDSQGCWTLTPNKLVPGPLPIVGTNLMGGIENTENFAGLNSGITWVSLIGTRRYIGASFVPSSSFTAINIRVWIRRVGSPQILNIGIWSDTAGLPNAQLAGTTVNLTDSPSVFQAVTISQALVSGTTYHLVFSSSTTTDSYANHWEVGTISGNVEFSSNGSAWSNSQANTIFYQITPAENDRAFNFFELDGALYAVDKRSDGGTPKLYLNGYRGTATSSTATSITDTTQSFNISNEGYVRIVSGTGVGQVRRITTTTSTKLTVLNAWDTNPDTTSQYVVVGVAIWNEITGHGLTKPVTSVISVDKSPGTAFMAQGKATRVRKMRFTGTTHQFADDSFGADLLYTAYNPSTKEVAVANITNGPPTFTMSLKYKSFTDNIDFTGTTTVPVGNPQYDITGVCEYNGKIYISKEDSLWTIEGTYAQKVNVGLDSSPNSFNGRAMVVNGLFLYFSYLHSVEKLYGTTLDDVGPWRGSGIPDGRTGAISYLVSAFSWIFASVDAGVNGTSSVLCYDGTGWHEIYRSSETGKRIRSIHWSSNESGKPVLWISVGAGMVGVAFPINTLNPLNDSLFLYNHEGILLTSTIDFGNARLPKFFKELAAIQKNLAQGIYIAVDYQLDANIGGTTWTYLGSFLQSPEDTLPQNFGNVRQIRLRLRLISNKYSTPPEVRAIIQEGYSRTPVKYQYNIRVREKPNQVNRRGGKDVDPDVLYNWLREKANGASRIRIRSRYKSIDNRDVIVEPPVLNRTSADSAKGSWGGELLITVRDA